MRPISQAVLPLCLTLVALAAAGCDPCRKSGDIDDDGVCDDIDLCDGDDATGDADADGVCDDLDVCTGDDASGDTDGDGSCNDVDDDDDDDGCLDVDDAAPEVASTDADGDSVPEDCDLCSGDDATGDTDGDLECNDIDVDDDDDGCTDDEDAAPLVASGDSDGDTIADDCDICEGDNDTGDVDADGICDDLDVPGNVEDLDVDANGAAFDATWTNPGDSDLAGILLVISEGEETTFVPADGTNYTVGEDVGGGDTVVFTSLDTAATFDVTAIGPDTVVSAWAFDDLAQYSEVPAVDSDRRVALGDQMASISVDLGAGTASVDAQPDNLSLDVSYGSFAAGTLTLTVGVTNDTGRLLFNLKAITDTLAAGSQSGPTFWVEDDKPYTYYGPEALAPGARAERTLTITGLSSSDPDLELYFVDAPMIYGGNYGGDFGGFDSSMSGETWDSDFNDPSNAGDNLRQGAITDDGRYILAGEKQTPFLSIIDTTTFDIVAGTDLSTSSNGEGNVGGVVVYGDMAYIVFNDGTHWHGYSSDTRGAVPTTVSLIELDIETLTETRRLTLYTDDSASRTGRSMAVHPDGDQFAVVLSDHDGDNKELWVVDRSTFTAVSGAGPLTLTSIGQAEYLVWSDDGSALGIGYNAYHYGDSGPVDFDLVDTTSFGVTSIALGTGGETTSVLGAANGNFYVSNRNSATLPFAVIDVATGAVTTPSLSGSSSSTGIVVEPSGDRYWVTDYSFQYPFDAATDTQIDADGDSSNGTSRIVSRDQHRAHFMVASPF